MLDNINSDGSQTEGGRNVVSKKNASNIIYWTRLEWGSPLQGKYVKKTTKEHYKKTDGIPWSYNEEKWIGELDINRKDTWDKRVFVSSSGWPDDEKKSVTVLSVLRSTEYRIRWRTMIVNVLGGHGT